MWIVQEIRFSNAPDATQEDTRCVLHAVATSRLRAMQIVDQVAGELSPGLGRPSIDRVPNANRELLVCGISADVDGVTHYIRAMHVEPNTVIDYSEGGVGVRA